VKHLREELRVEDLLDGERAFGWEETFRQTRPDRGPARREFIVPGQIRFNPAPQTTIPFKEAIHTFPQMNQQYFDAAVQRSEIPYPQVLDLFGQVICVSLIGLATSQRLCGAAAPFEQIAFIEA
jgi:hypothetical protein